MAILILFSALWRSQLTGTWDRLREPKSKMLRLVLLALIERQGMNDTSIFSVDQMWATCEKESWPWITLGPAQVPGVGKQGELIRERLRVYGRSEEQTEEPEQWVLLALQVRASVSAGALQRILYAPHEWESALHISQPERTRVR